VAQRQKRRPTTRASAFLNIPFDSKFERLYLAYIAGLAACGLVPRAALEVPSGGSMHDRIDRIFAIVKDCAYSLHDLSRVQIDRTSPRTPRFNMPFELGLAVAWPRLRIGPDTLGLCSRRKMGAFPSR
jgi:hypothetical protein